MDRSVFDVIVIGLGPAGIAAYTKLCENGLKVLPLEAGNRIGGRVNSVPFGDAIIDLGAEWCHGKKGNIIYEMIKDCNYVKSSGADDFITVTFVDSDQNMLPKEMSEKLSSLCCDLTYIGRERTSTNVKSLGDNFIDVYHELLNAPEYADISKSFANQTLEWFHKFENSLEASDSWFDTAGNSYSEYWECEGDHLLHWQGKGYKTLLDHILKTVPESYMSLINENLNKEVINIEYADDKKGEDIVKVKCKDGSDYSAKHVIITVSLGVLQERHGTLFSPQLPSAKVNSIKNLSLGTVNKMFLHFERRWWSNDMVWVGFLWRDEDKKRLSSDDQWLSEVFGFNSNDGQPNVMCLWITGPMSRFMETLPIERVQKGMCYILNLFLGKSFDIPVPVNITRSTWYSNPLFRGSYTFRSMDTEKFGASSLDLAAPVLNGKGSPVLCFAGESTSPHYYSTVHGALESGFRESQRIIDYYVSLKIDKPLRKSYAGEFIKKKVAIIGGGAAGLSAAKALVDFGTRDIVILESSDRLGGRIHSVRVDNDKYIELGAQWIHGKDNKFVDFVKKHDLIVDKVSYEGEGKFLRNDSYEYSQKLVDDVDNVVKNILEKCESFSSNTLECNFSVGEYLRSEFNKYVVQHVKQGEIPLWNELFNWHIRFQNVDNACVSIDNLSAKEWGVYDFNGGPSQSHVSFKNGFVSFVDKIAEEMPKETIKMSAPAKEIVWNNGNKVRVYCSNGIAYEVDHVIVAVPLGVLKDGHAKMFYPPLPSTHTVAIESIGFGPIEKVFLQFDKSWWGDDAKGFQLTWTEEELVWLKTVKKSANWLKYLTGFDVVTVGPPHTLIGWISSDGNELFQEHPEEIVIEQCHELLKRFTGNKDIPKPINMYRSNWDNNINIKGGFSHITRDCDKANIGPRDLAEPIYNSSGKLELLFAGEACHPTFFSTVHGAFESGLQQAEKLFKILESNNQNLSKL